MFALLYFYTRVKANREADMTFSRAINPTGKLNQNIRSAGLAGSGWRETSRVGSERDERRQLQFSGKRFGLILRQSGTKGDQWPFN